MSYTVRKNPQGFFQIFHNGCAKLCPHQDIFFADNPLNPGNVLVNKQNCASDCSHFDFDPREGKNGEKTVIITKRCEDPRHPSIVATVEVPVDSTIKTPKLGIIHP
jgi:hypothetical protein